VTGVTVTNPQTQAPNGGERMSAPTQSPADAAPIPLSWRAALGVVTPSTNRIIEPDFAAFCPPGVTLHVARSWLADDIEIDPSKGDEGFADLVEAIDKGTVDALRDVMTCRPDYIPMGMSIETFWGGAEGAHKYLKRTEDQTGLRASIGSFAILEGLKRFGAQKISIVCPYFPIGAEHIARFFTDHGIEVVRSAALECLTPHDMAAVPEARLVEVLRDLDGPDVDAIVQAGGNMSMVRLADAAERWLGKPVIAINTAIMWQTLRNLGIEDRFEGLGSLVREF
jgi:maleate isomerase